MSESTVNECTLFICETFKEEITRAVADVTGNNITICLVPHFCSSGTCRLERINQFLNEQCGSYSAGLYFGDIELYKQGFLPVGVTHAGPDACNALFAPEEWIMTLVSGGAYVILPGWLLSWERHVMEMGFDPKVPTSFYSSNMKDIVLLDTGVVPMLKERIRSFEEFSGLPIRTVPVGIEYFSSIIQTAIYQWQNAHLRISNNHDIASMLESAARQMAVITLISDIARVSEERDVISRIITTCQSLFAPRFVHYLPIQLEGPSQMISTPSDPDEEKNKTLLLSTRGKEFEFSPDGAGFCIPIIYQDKILGILGISGVTAPGRIREYLNLTLSFTRFLGLAIQNARSWNELKNSKRELEESNIEIQNKNKELLVISEKLRSSNQELIKSQKELTESELFIKGIVNSAHVGIAVIDSEFHTLFFNPEMERMFDQKYQNIQGKNFLEAFPSLKQNKRYRYLIQALSGEMVQAPDFEFSSEESGKPLWISSIFSPVYDLHQDIIGVIINVYDITQRKESERNLERAYNAIRIAQEKLTILSSITRHDILNRVMVVTAYSGMLKERISDEKDVKLLNAIAISGKDIQHLIEFTREYQELGVKKPTWLQIRDVMKRRSVQSVLSGIDLTIQGVAAEIYVDPMLEKVMYNLVENSRRHGERVSAINLCSEQAGEDLIIAYSDNGVGVPVQEKELIFKQGHGKNTGMGLFLIREILSLTNIAIKECGVPGEGVRFEITVPKGGWRKISQENVDI